MNSVFVIGGIVRDKYKGNIHKFEHQMGTQGGVSSLALMYFEDLDQFLMHLPAKTTVVVIEQNENSKKLESFTHPENVTYIFGREAKGILESEIQKIRKHIETLQEGIPEEHLQGNTRTAHFDLVSIDTPESLNLGVCASIVMYDRHAKSIPF